MRPGTRRGPRPERLDRKPQEQLLRIPYLTGCRVLPLGRSTEKITVGGARPPYERVFFREFALGRLITGTYTLAFADAFKADGMWADKGQDRVGPEGRAVTSPSAADRPRTAPPADRQGGADVRPGPSDLCGARPTGTGGRSGAVPRQRAVRGTPGR
ncbi:hypothetical protein GCM10023336_12090 [Streptomyces similanensis]|uniref:Uncharacterized protein n=1 Tax=Streptomyces similanensis TaxID=1274988 RepID=A0ABP9JZ36_9ACTN